VFSCFLVFLFSCPRLDLAYSLLTLFRLHSLAWNGADSLFGESVLAVQTPFCRLFVFFVITLFYILFWRDLLSFTATFCFLDLEIRNKNKTSYLSVFPVRISCPLFGFTPAPADAQERINPSRRHPNGVSSSISQLVFGSRFSVFIFSFPIVCSFHSLYFIFYILFCLSVYLFFSTTAQSKLCFA